MDIKGLGTEARVNSNANAALQRLVQTLGSQGLVEIEERVELSSADIRTLLQRLPKSSALAHELRQRLAQAAVPGSNSGGAAAPLSATTVVGLTLAKLRSNAEPQRSAWVLLEPAPSPHREGSKLDVFLGAGPARYQLPTPNSAHSLPNRTGLEPDANRGAPLVTDTARLNSAQAPEPGKLPQLDASTKALIQTALRHYLPQLQAGSAAHKASAQALNPIVAAVREARFSEAALDRLLAGTAQNLSDQNQAVQRLSLSLLRAHHWFKALPQLSTPNPTAVQDQLRHSGLFFERHLAQLSPGPPAHSTAVAQEPSPSRSAPALAASDTKALLLSLLQSWTTVSAVRPGTAESMQTPPDSLLDAMLKIFFHKTPAPTADKPEWIRPQLEQLEAGLKAAVARISVQQLAHLSGRHEHGTNPTQADIFLRLSENVIPVHLSMWLPPDEDEAETRARRKNTSAARRWRFLIEWQLDPYGRFSSDIEFDKGRLSTRLWAEQTPIRENLNAHLSTLQARLEAEGVVVGSLRCVNEQRSAQVQPCPTDEHLIDIKT